MYFNDALRWARNCKGCLKRRVGLWLSIRIAERSIVQSELVKHGRLEQIRQAALARLRLASTCL